MTPVHASGGRWAPHASRHLRAPYTLHHEESHLYAEHPLLSAFRAAYERNRRLGERRRPAPLGAGRRYDAGIAVYTGTMSVMSRASLSNLGSLPGSVTCSISGSAGDRC